MKKLNIGLFEILPKEKEYETYSDLLKDYSMDTPNSDGVRISKFRESYYLLKEFKSLGVCDNLKKYSYNLITEIIVEYDVYANGTSVEIIIDNPSEIEDFKKGEFAIGYDSDGEEHQVKRGTSYLIDWVQERSTFFLVRSI